MKKYFLVLALFFGITTYTNAQQKVPTATELTAKSIDAMDKRLKLNPTQKNIIYNYTLDMYKEQLAISKKQQNGTFTENDVARSYKLQNENTEKIRSILKGEQQTEYDKFVEEQLRGGKKKKKGKQAKEEEEEVVTGISGLILPTKTPY